MSEMLFVTWKCLRFGLSPRFYIMVHTIFNKKPKK